MKLDFKALGISKHVVSCWSVKEAPSLLRDLNLNGKGKLIWVVPDQFSDHVTINSLFSETIKGATVYVS